ncbi:MAG: DEAD/DEAH box helicase [Candidatus Eremiobacteraeota bacterium]|nr:DEAD/DEAH box helicase [Candidatus Eremiobacteraeota bacterium]
MLAELLAVSGLSLSKPAWSTGLRAYARTADATLPSGDLDPVLQELIDHNLVVRSNDQVKLLDRFYEDIILQIRKERRAGLASSALFDHVFPLLSSPFDKAQVNFRTSLLFGTARYVNQSYHQFEGAAGKPRELAQIARGWLHAESFQQVDSRWHQALLEKSLEWAVEHCEEAPGAVAFCERQSQLNNQVLLYLGLYWFMRGNDEQTKRFLQAANRIPSLPGLVAFDLKRYDIAVESFAQAASRTENPVLYLPVTRLTRVLCLLRKGDAAQAQTCCGPDNQGVDPWLRWLCDQRQGKARHSRPSYSAAEMTSSLWLTVASCALTVNDRELQSQLRESGEQLAQQAQSQGFLWVERQVRRFLHKFDHARAECSPWDCVVPEQPWKLRLKQLMDLAQKPRIEPEERIIWTVRPVAAGWEAVPKLQSQAKRGGWSKGRQLELFRTPPPCADEYDLRVFRQALARNFTLSDVFHSLVGHPRVFHEDTGQQIEVVEGRPEFQVNKGPNGLAVRILPSCLDSSGQVLEMVGHTSLKVYRFDPLLREFSEILGDGLEVPESEQAAVQLLLDKLPAEFAIASDLASDAVQEVAADATLYLRIRPLREGLELNMLVRPLGSDGPEYPPTHGGQRVLLRQHGRRVQGVRNLELESQACQAVLDACPGFGPEQGTAHWVTTDLSASLEVLEQVGRLPPEALTVEWPEGQSMRIRHRVSGENLRLQAETQGEWFNVQGQLELSAEEHWHLQELLERMRNQTSRFIALGSGEFLALTEELRRRLEELTNLVEPSKGKAIKVHGLLAGALQEVAPTEGDEFFQQRLARLNDSQSIKPPLPKTFQAELRGYQQEGFEWLSQRAHWGVGACLSDDMGLGKTLQTLALLVHRAPLGPALVIAPTSVCGNWLEEARRFAPTLRVHWLLDGERQTIVEKAEAFDVLLVSYGVVVREMKILSARTFATLVVDEAQAIKNHATQRFQAVLKIPSDFRVVTTGTPVENRLEELWALFRFLNPGLLGSLERFRERFIAPIEAGQAQARQHLKKLVHPFLLRRTKTQVLHELPARTDITLEVPLSPAERTFYEALRTRALEKLNGSEIEAMQVLAELTRLRRACCHPSLVEPKKKAGEGSKLEAVRELLHDMRQGGHRALIFSQFVDHLQLLRQELDQQGLSYQYLDGTTPAQERLRRVKAFQAGEGDVFLISLRAGGFGLNLTGADYVIHMDPWWNPAVEDQASDRAHRIGQQRPVTVYRLVAKDTVEEKILALHRQKRELAHGLLEGAEEGVRLSAGELLALMQA